jgi:hypothetical protein
MDFKAQLIKDMATFHNPGEFATETDIWYDGKPYRVPLILDHETAKDRRQLAGDNADGIHAVEVVVYIAQTDIGFVPRKNHNIEIDIAGAIMMYNILKSDYEDGEIILELGAFDE